MLERSVVEEIKGILLEPDIETKMKLTVRLCVDAGKIGRVRFPRVEERPLGALRPARPAHWNVVEAHAISDRPKLGTAGGRYRLMHSIANIELAAVELMLLSIADFPAEPPEYYHATFQIAREEVMHTRMLMRRLRHLGGDFGDEPVHMGLWRTAVQWTDLPGRLGVVPRIFEARGLDVSDRLRKQLGAAGDARSAAALERIYRDEIRHVSVGTLWYRAACELRGLDPEAHFIELLRDFRPRRGTPGRINRVGRKQAGFTERELAVLEGGDDPALGPEAPPRDLPQN